ncbi:MAG TPA: beta-ketoacyl-[acyl-carrier-protein] synthase family protein [Thermoanaerobaculaceae bacterium]|nr:beta-ketoacyl-[acyl-carrier-protein] synthase family protein [Thermoanaerobaculaceae bacterium]HRS16870.1 beta-ketoacyl-[acyl-carrier-protein] synthase family protein [Thermoanaerobaculaceae bacterium]
MKDVWITGIGLVTALGPDRDTTWRRLVTGESGIRPLTLFDPSGFRTRIAAQVDDAALPALDLPRHSSRATRFALVAATEAMADAGLPLDGPPRHWALVMGGGAAGLFETEGFIGRRLSKGPRTRGLSEFVELLQDTPTDRLAARFGLEGPRLTITTACSSSTLSVGMAAELIADGLVDVALAGGADAICRLTYAGFNSLRAVDLAPCRPFDRNRQGLTVGEGAAVLVLEAGEHARARGARPYARVLGYGATNDAFHMTQPEPSGEAWARTLLAALEDAGVGPDAIDYINAHGTATEQNDAAECAAYRRVLGERLARVPVSSVKGALGHCLCGAGGIEAAITSLAIARQVVPPTVGFAEPDPACPVDPVPGVGRPHTIACAVSSSFAFGGNSGVLVLGSCR